MELFGIKPLFGGPDATPPSDIDLPAGQILVGNDSNKATAVNMSSQATINSIGAVTLQGTPTFTSVTVAAAPSVATDLTNKAYVDMFISGLTPLTASRVATTTNLTAIYSNGTSGVGATLTNSGAQAAISIDGVSLSLNDRVLVKNQSTAAQNGIYTVTNVGNVSTNWVLTRGTDFDTSAEMLEGSYTNITAGTVNSGMVYIFATSQPITVGTTALTFNQFGVFQQTITLSGDVSGSGTTAITTAIGNNKVTNAMLRQSAGLSIVGNSTNSTADVADITAASDGQVLRRSGTAVGFGAINLASTNAVSNVLPNANTTATSANVANTIVSRNGFGDITIRNLTTAAIIGSGDFETTGAMIAAYSIINRSQITTLLGAPLTVGDLVNFNNAGTNAVLADAATGLQAQAVYRSDAGGGSFICDFLSTFSDVNATLGVSGDPIFLAAGGGQPTLNRVTQPGYLDQQVGYSWGGYTAISWAYLPSKIIPPSVILGTNPTVFLSSIYNGGITGSASNVTGLANLGSASITGTKSGTGNITLTTVGNSVLGINFGSTNTDRGFGLGTVAIADLMTGAAFTAMAVLRPTNTDNALYSIFEWISATDTFDLYYNPSTGNIKGLIYDNGVGGEINGTVANLSGKVTVITWTSDSSGNHELYANSIRIATATLNVTPDGSATAMSFGKASDASAAKGWLPALTFWPSKLTTAERVMCENYLATTFGVT